MNVTLAPLSQLDLDEITLAFKQIGWHKPKIIYEIYLKEQSSGLRSVLIARESGKFCGYVTLKCISEYPSFAEKNILEIVDLNVLPEYQKQGIGTKLIEKCQNIAIEKGMPIIGIGVGLISDYDP